MSKRKEKLMVRVLSALQEGADTSNEIADMLGHPVANVSATLSEMAECGLARKTGFYKIISGKRKTFCWEPSVTSGQEPKP